MPGAKERALLERPSGPGIPSSSSGSALLFLYRDVLRVELAWLDRIVRAKHSVRLPVVLSREEVASLWIRDHE